MQRIQAIETRYKGYRFRSRLEARWAVFFDTLGIRWEYEKEGYNLGEVGLYLPDFWLPNVGHRGTRIHGVWLEIKGQAPTSIEDQKCFALTRMTGSPTFLFVGMPGDDDNNNEGGYEYVYSSEDGGGWDSGMCFMRCYNDRCKHIKIEFYEGSYMVCPKCDSQCDDEHPQVQAAISAARGARFESYDRNTSSWSAVSSSVDNFGSFDLGRQKDPTLCYYCGKPLNRQLWVEWLACQHPHNNDFTYVQEIRYVHRLCVHVGSAPMGTCYIKSGDSIASIDTRWLTADLRAFSCTDMRNWLMTTEQSDQFHHIIACYNEHMI
jgi:hypothetical protein